MSAEILPTWYSHVVPVVATGTSGHVVFATDDNVVFATDGHVVFATAGHVVFATDGHVVDDTSGPRGIRYCWPRDNLFI